jgi:hypothetical protein
MLQQLVICTNMTITLLMAASSLAFGRNSHQLGFHRFGDSMHRTDASEAPQVQQIGLMISQLIDQMRPTAKTGQIAHRATVPRSVHSCIPSGKVALARGRRSALDHATKFWRHPAGTRPSTRLPPPTALPAVEAAMPARSSRIFREHSSQANPQEAAITHSDIGESAPLFP